ncbi:hypothetical protein BC833DRAFT_411646 [Globomyces pollinis-pini]|nr:hypothetical protein BC833DRAFT_411646 [Globomyces pollinis-pini]
MELPDIGKACSISGCPELNDYLLLKCSHCKGRFCQNHSKPHDMIDNSAIQNGHYCKNLPLDSKAIVCPVCNQIVPVDKGSDPNIVVTTHINRGCNKIQKEKVYQNQCSFKGCTKRELIPIQCNVCTLTHCIKHRLEQDHKCTGPPPKTFKSTIGSAFSTNSNNSGKNARKNSSSSTKKNDCALQ